jgi:hypothetical protein
MAFANLFRRHSVSNEAHGAVYACMDQNSTAETLLDELETQCRNSSALISLRTKRNSEVLAHEGGLLASTYNSSSSKRRSSVDYSWLTPQNNLLQVPSELYNLSDITKMELNELIQYVAPEDCASVVNNFRRHLRSQIQPTTPENIIATFRNTLANYIEHKHKHHLNLNEPNNPTSKTISSLVRNNRIVPKYPSEEELHSIAELTQISLTSPSNHSTELKPRSNTHV